MPLKAKTRKRVRVNTAEVVNAPKPPKEAPNARIRTIKAQPTMGARPAQTEAELNDGLVEDRKHVEVGDLRDWLNPVRHGPKLDPVLTAARKAKKKKKTVDLAPLPPPGTDGLPRGR